MIKYLMFLPLLISKLFSQVPDSVHVIYDVLGNKTTEVYHTMNETKECAACKKDLPLTEFYKRSETTYRTTCKKCKRVNTKKQIEDRVSAENKVCKHCLVEKPVSEYGKAGRWLQPYCKECDAVRKRKHRDQNASKYQTNSRKKYLETRVLVSEEQKISSRIKSNLALAENSRKYSAQRKMKLTDAERKEKKFIQGKAYRLKYKSDITYVKKKYSRSPQGKQKAKDWQARMMLDPQFKIIKNFRSRIRVALRGIIKKSGTTESILGCTFPEFKVYIESQFKDGMAWSNYGRFGWHIDHKIPVSWFNLENENCQKLAFNYKNHQPLWWEDNLKKNNKYHTQMEHNYV